MNWNPYAIRKSTAITPLILSSPHSGRNYPDDFGFTCSLEALRRLEDAYVDELIADAPLRGATVIQAEFPRSYIDLNRAEDDLDPAVLAAAWPEPLQPSPATRSGLGLVRRLCRNNVPIYAAPLPVAAVRQRLDDYYRPYHAALRGLLDSAAENCGEAWLIDCHSMPAHGPDGARPDFVLGDRDGASCDAAFTCMVRDALQDMGYRVALNKPYKGVEILRRYGEPLRKRQALQLEINRGLYMNEETVTKHDGFIKLRGNLMALIARLSDEWTQRALNQQAAE